MKLHPTPWLSLTLSLLGCLPAQPSLAQTTVIVTPEALTATGMRGEAEPAIRTLAIRATEPVTDLQIHTLDLYSRDRDRVFPQALITVPTTISSVEVGTLTTLPVAFNLQAAPSGEFQGSLLLSYGGDQVTVPITVRVKDAWYLPLALLILGVILGTTVSSYSRWGKTTDELTVGIETLRTLVQKDSEIPPSFASGIAVYLADAHLARDVKQLEKSRQSLNAAGEMWGKWFRERPAWLSALQAGKELQSQLAEQLTAVSQAPYLQTIQSNLQTVLDNVANFDNAAALGQTINRFSQQSTQYLRVLQQYRQFQQTLEELNPDALPPSDQETLQDMISRADAWKEILVTLRPSDSGDDPQLQTIGLAIAEAKPVLNTLKQKAEDSVPVDGLREFKPGKGKAAIETSPPSEVAMPQTTVMESPVPALDDTFVFNGIATLIKNPKQRLKLFAIAGYLTTIGFLAGTGFNQLYLENPTFGSSGLRDYFALLAWGFGAEATRSAVTNALRRTDGARD
ncbi:hypothetical protein XM38_013190 [Halomicronema hongdechloris C2206]|uniref:Uncharacterized protein n=1 Tax=Halomicronema hongdechloris C2206 TaxID=1641165 RepID=A0A1Z3HJA5_9CYAN|nr:hypothetical protein [Halomicronema hongdechloris]ASC70381.1 hypothetical protein XM38_013190 [Halomicronema hongdechloris C2206]